MFAYSKNQLSEHASIILDNQISTVINRFQLSKELFHVWLQDEGTFQMKQPARELLHRLGSRRAQLISWRDMWAMVAQKGIRMYGESFSKSTDFNTWGASVLLRTQVPLIANDGDHHNSISGPRLLFFLPGLINSKKNETRKKWLL